MAVRNDIAREAAYHHFLDLIEILDSFDQCSKLSLALDCLYSKGDFEHKPLFEAMENTVRHLRGLPSIGLNEYSQTELNCHGCMGPCGNCGVGHD